MIITTRDSSLEQIISIVESVTGDLRTARRVATALCDQLGGGHIYLPKLDRARKQARVLAMREAGVSATEIAQTLKIPRSTVFSWLQQRKQKAPQ